MPHSAAIVFFLYRLLQWCYHLYIIVLYAEPHVSALSSEMSVVMLARGLAHDEKISLTQTP